MQPEEGLCIVSSMYPCDELVPKGLQGAPIAEGDLTQPQEWVPPTWTSCSWAGVRSFLGLDSDIR